MKIIQKIEQDRLILELRGDFDHWSSPGFLESVEGLVTSGHTVLDLDLAQVGFLSSEGVGTLLKVWRILRLRGGVLRVTRMSDVVRWTLMSLGVVRLLVTDHRAA